MVLGKLSVPWLPTYLDESRARAYRACSSCGWVLFGHFSCVYLFSFLSPSLGDGPIKSEILSQRVVKPKPTNKHVALEYNLIETTKKTRGNDIANSW